MFKQSQCKILPTDSAVKTNYTSWANVGVTAFWAIGATIHTRDPLEKSSDQHCFERDLYPVLLQLSLSARVLQFSLRGVLR